MCDYASNVALVAYLKREEDNGRAVVWQKLHEVAAGLSYLHSMGIVHCNLMGNNIVVGTDGTAMLASFSMAFNPLTSLDLILWWR